ncbi:MAG: GAF domain-containing protein [Candidatus Eisenbacteria bacterium]|nr:GAF domain-containing protein [Candidatus Eisenbacteria bacterium]
MEQPTPSSASGAATPRIGDSPVWPALAAFFEGDADLESLERMLLAFATHPHGAGASSAWLLLWNARSGLLEGWRESAPASVFDLARAIAEARRAGPRGAADERLHAWADSAERLEGPLAEAWRGQSMAIGAGSEQPGTPWSSAEQVGVIALRRGARAYGALVCAWPHAVVPQRDREALEWLRATADAAFGAQARAADARRRLRQGAALAELARSSVSSINLAEALHLLARVAAEGAEVRGSAVYRADARGTLKVDVAHGAAVVRDSFARAFVPAAQQCCDSRQPLVGERSDEAPNLPPGIAGETSVWAALPIVAYGRALGALVVHDGPDRHPAAPALERADLEYLATLADHAALLLEHARQVDDARRNEQTRQDQLSRLRELDRLAAVGEMAVRVAQESRNPIASITAFARRAHRELAEDDPRREYLEIVLRESERLDAMLGEQMEYSQLQRPRLEMQSLNAVVQEALQRFSETLVRRRVRLLKRLAPDLPQLLLDAHRIRRVVENIVAYSLESVPLGGRIKIESRRASGYVVVDVAHDGARHAGDLLDQLFVPFSAGNAGGAGVGLGVAQQIVREHGGEVRLRGEGEWGTVFSFTLPISGNEDRRKASDRRSVRGERRRRGDGENPARS